MSNNIVQRLATKNFNNNLIESIEEEIFESFNKKNQNKIDNDDSNIISLYLDMFKTVKTKSRTICCHANHPEFRIPEK